ncbi:MAG: prepilin-type N-terminal cleavage/methylation domain-containing protein [Elusimicrobia bacterium]|nr:prepilin-type N-terminal cleavage/methylation domain-containing protein [Elusimicrobiota bacterium]
MRKFRERAGYTLTELMLVVAIVGILSTIGPGMLTSMQNFFLMTSARYEIQRDARTTLDTVNRYLRQAVASTVIIDTNGQGPFSRIRFKHVDGRYMEFRQNGKKLIQVIDTAESVVSENLVYIAFTYPHTDDTSIISVAITMGKSIQLGRRKVLELTIQKIRVMN